jgi:hypothetical protein
MLGSVLASRNVGRTKAGGYVSGGMSPLSIGLVQRTEFTVTFPGVWNAKKLHIGVLMSALGQNVRLSVRLAKPVRIQFNYRTLQVKSMVCSLLSWACIVTASISDRSAIDASL